MFFFFVCLFVQHKHKLVHKLHYLPQNSEVKIYLWYVD